MRVPKVKSKELFNNSVSEMKEMMFDFYRTNELINWTGTHQRSISYYTILNNEIEKLEVKNTEKLKQYIYDEYFKYNETLNLIPTGWEFQESLKSSISLRFLSSFVPQINIGIDNGRNKVVLIELSNGLWE